MANIEKLQRRVEVLEEQLAELTKRFEEFAARPDPNRPIGPKPDQRHPVWPHGTHDRLKEPGDEVVWPPITRHL